MAHGLAKQSLTTSACGRRAGARESHDDDLILPNQPFVMKIAGEYRNLGLPFEDLLNEGNVGLLEAAQRFDPDRGARFITYAIFWIRKSILRALSRHACLVRVPDYRVRQANAIRETGRSLSRNLGRAAAPDEIGRALSLTPEKMEQILHARMKSVSIDAPPGESDDVALLDRLADPRAVSPEVGLIHAEHAALLRVALRGLSPQQRTVIVGRFGLTGGRARTLREMGDRLGLSRERVRQIEVAATKSLRRTINRGRRARPAGQVSRRSARAGTRSDAS